MRQKSIACRLALIDSFQLAAAILLSLSVTYHPNFNFQLIQLQSTNKNHSRFDLWIYIYTYICQTAKAWMMTSNHPTGTRYPGSGLGQGKGTGAKTGDQWGRTKPTKNRWKMYRHFWYAFFMLFLCLYVCLFVCLFCLFVAGSLLILMFHFQQYFFPSFLMAESKSPNEGAWCWGSEAGLWTGKDVVAGGRFDSPAWCCYLGCLGHYLGVYFIRWYVYIYICDYMICNIDLSSG